MAIAEYRSNSSLKSVLTKLPIRLAAGGISGDRATNWVNFCRRDRLSAL